MKRKALVTGGSGFIGSRLVNKLLENNYDVIVLDDLSNGSGKKALPKNIKFIRGTILNYSRLKKICSKVDVVFHLAVKPLTMSFDKPEEVVKVNDFGTYLVAKTCSELKIKLIHVSSSEAYGTALIIPMTEKHPLFPSTIYASSKAAAELYVRGFVDSEKLKMVMVRPFNSYGTFMRDDTYAAAIPKFFNRIHHKKDPIIFGTGNQTRDFTYVDDTCNGIMLADQTKNAIGETFNIGQGEEVSIKKIAKLMIENYQNITNKDVNVKLSFKKPRKGDVARHLSDISHAKKILGYKPSIKLDEGLANYITWKLNI